MPTLKSIEKYWNARGGHVGVPITAEELIAAVINNHTSAEIGDYTVMVEVTPAHQLYTLIYACETSSPHKVGDDTHFDLLPRRGKRPSHFVIDITGDAIPEGRVQWGETLEDAITDVVDNTLQGELDMDYEPDARRIEIMLTELTVEQPLEWDDLTFTLTTCNCAGHDKLDLIRRYS